MARSQAAERTTDSRIPLPASAVLSILANALAAPVLSDPTREAARLRRAFSVTLAFLFMGRQGFDHLATIVRLRLRH